MHSPARLSASRGSPFSGSRVLAGASLSAAALLVAACGREPAPANGGGAPDAPAAPAATAQGAGFVEGALAAGLKFQMNFLPTEQGENFKINLYDHGSGVAVADIDGDGDDDVYLLNQLGPNALFRNDGGRFTDITATAGVALADRVSVAGVFGDYDNDGDQDLYVTSTRGGDVLFRNDGTGRFEDVTQAAGLELVQHSETPAFFDMDGDGDLDLFVTNTALWTLDTRGPGGTYYEGLPDLLALQEMPPEPNRMYRNDGGGRFTDVTAEAGVAGTGWGGDVAVFDMDGDGDLDLFVSNMFGRSLLFRNLGRGRFERCEAEVLGKTSWGAVGARPFDADVDGLLDLLVMDMHSDMWVTYRFPKSVVEPSKKYESFSGRSLALGYKSQEAHDDEMRRMEVHLDAVVFGTTLFHNLGGGRFEEVSDRTGVETFWPWGAAVGDFDQDGAPDVFVPSGMGAPFFFWPSALLMNRGDGTFVNRAQEFGIDPPPGGPNMDVMIQGLPAVKSARAAAVADFDGDGRLDLVVNNFNDRAHLFWNRFPERHWVGLRLRATASNADAVGALVTLEVGGRKLLRQVDTSCGYLAQSSRMLHFGLGDATRVDRCEIRWPGGRVQTVQNVSIDRVQEIVEPRDRDGR